MCCTSVHSFHIQICFLPRQMHVSGVRATCQTVCLDQFVTVRNKRPTLTNDEATASLECVILIDMSFDVLSKICDTTRPIKKASDL